MTELEFIRALYIKMQLMINESGCFFRSFSWEKNFRSRNLRIIVSNSFTNSGRSFFICAKESFYRLFCETSHEQEIGFLNDYGGVGCC
ncbi:hypothetical protein LmNIHS28_01713 [Listeria monocytogenes]|nr:hypothetical protein F2382_01509 [Listeria monocytogenes]GAM95781.1 hypothetical protein LmNIHS28_01713 [Listeria monocytogenes]